MNIQVKDLIPQPLAGTDQNGSGLWLNGQIDFECSKTNLVLSASGRGKSSLVSFLYGTRKDYHGSVFFEGKDISKFSFDEWIEYRKNKLAVVFQDLRLFENLSMLENIRIKNSITNFKTEEEIHRMSEILGIKNLLGRKISTLSYGQQQRVAIIRALCQPFSWIFLDEPFSHLDKVNISIAMQLIEEEANKQNAGILITLLHPEESVVSSKIVKI